MYYYLETHYQHIAGRFFDGFKLAETSEINTNISINHSNKQDIHYSNSFNRKNIDYVIEKNFVATNVSNLMTNIIDVDNSDSSVEFLKTTDKKKSNSIISKHSTSLSTNKKNSKKIKIV